MLKLRLRLNIISRDLIMRHTETLPGRAGLVLTLVLALLLATSRPASAQDDTLLPSIGSAA